MQFYQVHCSILFMYGSDIYCVFLLFLRLCHFVLFQKSAQTVLRGCEEQCGSPRVRTLSTSRAPPLLSRLSETSSADESMSDVESIPCSPQVAPGSIGKSPISKYPSCSLLRAEHV